MLVTGTEALTPVRVFAFAATTGDVLWQRSDEWALTRSDVVGLGELVVGRNEGGDLVALEATTGELRWHTGHEGRRYRPDVAESPAVVAGDVVFSAPDGALYRVDGESGAVVWRHALDCDVTTSVAVNAGDVYAGCGDGRLFRLAAGTGEERASMALPRDPDGRLAVLDDRVIIPGGVRWIGAVDRALNGILWEHSPRPGVRLSVVQPLVHGDAVLTGDGDGRLFALDLEDGSVRWTARLEGQIRGLGQHQDVLLVGTIEGILYALRANSLP